MLKDTQHVSGGVRAGTQVCVTLDLSPQPPCCPASWVSVTSSVHLRRRWPTRSLPLVAGCSLPPPPLDIDDALPDLDLLPPPPPPPPADLPPPDEEPPSAMGASLISDLEQLHLPPPPPPPQVLPTPWYLMELHGSKEGGAGAFKILSLEVVRSLLRLSPFSKLFQAGKSWMCFSRSLEKGCHTLSTSVPPSALRRTFPCI